MNIERRRLLCSCAGLLGMVGCGGNGVPGPVTTGPDSSARGCMLSLSAGTNLPGCGQPLQSSGSIALDQAFVQEFYQQQAFFALPMVSFAFLSDCDSPNAYAQPGAMSILFGTTLARTAFARYGSALPLWQILAHEFGHMMQFAYGATWLEAPTVAPKELEADMFSGFYLLLMKSFVSPAEMQTTLQQAFSTGDYAYYDSGHHGTPVQRMAALMAGGRIAAEYAGGQIAHSLEAVRHRFLQELRQITAW